MDFEWVAIAFNDVAWILLAFVFGLCSRIVGLPPLVGFLGAGFLLNAMGFQDSELLEKLADLGITLLLFTVGLKLDLKMLARPQVWALTGIHMAVVTGVFSGLLYAAALTGFGIFADMTMQKAVLIAFALSFSSTVFVVKSLEDRGVVKSLHGRISIGVLIMQDIVAVIFLAFSEGNIPSLWAFLLLLLIPLRPVLILILRKAGHGELLVLYGFLLALGGAEIFEYFGVKGDLGALIFGLLISTHYKAEEMAKTMLGFKDLFLLGFFLSIGLSGAITWQTLGLSALLTAVIVIKTVLFFVLFTTFRLRARTSLLATINLTNYSEFGLIVLVIGVTNGWIGNEWLIALSVALSMSFFLAATMNKYSYHIYRNHKSFWKKWQSQTLLTEDRVYDIGGAKVIIIGMGGVGTGAYDKLRDEFGDALIGVDIDPVTVRNQQSTGRYVLLGDPSDADFWDRIQIAHSLDLVMIALPRVKTTLAVLERIKQTSLACRIGATARFPDEEEELKNAGVHAVFNVYTEAGAGFAAHVSSEIPDLLSKEEEVRRSDTG